MESVDFSLKYPLIRKIGINKPLLNFGMTRSQSPDNSDSFQIRNQLDASLFKQISLKQFLQALNQYAETNQTKKKILSKWVPFHSDDATKLLSKLAYNQDDPTFLLNNSATEAEWSAFSNAVESGLQQLSDLKLIELNKPFRQAGTFYGPVLKGLFITDLGKRVLRT